MQRSFEFTRVEPGASLHKPERMVVRDCREAFSDQWQGILSAFQMNTGKKLKNHAGVGPLLFGRTLLRGLQTLACDRESFVDPADDRQGFGEMVPIVNPVRIVFDGLPQKRNVARG